MDTHATYEARLVGDSWPLPLYPAFYEYHAPGRQAPIHRCHFDEAQPMIVLEFITPHISLRRKINPQRTGRRARGIEMHRRCLSPAHSADFEKIADEALHAGLEARNLVMGAELMHTSENIGNAGTPCDLARSFNERELE